MAELLWSALPSWITWTWPPCVRIAAAQSSVFAWGTVVSPDAAYMRTGLGGVQQVLLTMKACRNRPRGSLIRPRNFGVSSVSMFGSAATMESLEWPPSNSEFTMAAYGARNATPGSVYR